MSEYVDRMKNDRLKVGAVFGVVMAAALAAWGTFGEDDYEASEYLFVLAIILVAAALVYGLVARRWPGATTALVLGVLAIVSIAVFWAGLPPVFATAAIALGLGLRHGENRTAGNVAVGLGVLALVLDLAVYIADMT